MNREYSLNLLTEKREFLKRIVEFNHPQSDGFLPEELTGTRLYDAIMSDPRYKRRFIPPKKLFFDFENIYNRLVFLKGDSLYKLSLIISGCMCSNILQSTINKTSVIPFMEFLGEDIYKLSLQRGSLYFPVPLKEKVQGFYESPELAVTNCGANIISFFISSADEEYRQFIDFKTESKKILSFSETEKQILFNCIRKIIILEIDSSCQSIFY